MINDPIADFLVRIRNAAAVRKGEMTVPYSRMKGEMARILKREGYIVDYKVETSEGHPELRLVLKYAGRESAIQGVKRISKPGVRVYVGSNDIPRVLGGMGISILSTPKGILTGRDARKQRVGGEILAYVY
ncbi:MAG: 30S ribosomal protein S8 [Verrucomicrobiota bacterium]|nr:30S ribosomal protein S8 [Verrucomicrobiota bacterium]